MKGAIYNEMEGFAADWLENLIDAGHIAAGKVDRRSIKDLEPADVAGAGQRHFFAGIGVWQYALRLAGVTDAANVWTGSCPCQPFSAAGKRRGVDDERHLWPDWFALIRECRPSIIFGEQVAGAAGVEWLAAVFADLESCGYACAGADLAAASVGAPHKRQRLFWVAHLHGSRLEKLSETHSETGRDACGDAVDRRGERGGLGNTAGARRKDAEQKFRFFKPDFRRGAGGLGDTDGDSVGEHAGELHADETQHVERSESGDHRAQRASANGAMWNRPNWVYCNDPGGARWRPIEPGTFPLAAGVAGRVGRVRAYGNAIVAPLAAQFILASLEAIEEQQ